MLRPRSCTAPALRAAVRQVLYGHRFKSCAARLAGLLADAPGPPRAAELRAAELLESLALTGPSSQSRLQPAETGASG
jgi:UDP:flavonoid glycosyltransferase YjiC (YdhE family)